MGHIITQVQPNGVAARHGLRAGDCIERIGGEELIDQIDYQALTAHAAVTLDVTRENGEPARITLHKPADMPLGLTLADTIACTPRACKNKCIFCFIDQMPKAMRSSLYVKDDDWRLSLLMGNYITLTNVDDAEFARILRRKASPLYISVHAASPEVRVRMMRNPNAANLLPRLEALKAHGLRFHCQIVLCPGVNDGGVLDDTLRTLSALYPAARSAALVPVGLTRHREGLEKLSPYTQAQAANVIAQAEAWQETLLARIGTRFVFPSDELYCIARKDIPQEDAYEGYPQIENGVGLLRMFEESLKNAQDERKGAYARARRVLIACGASVAPVMTRWMNACAPEGVSVTVKPIVNHFFGETVTVTGLLTGGDLLAQLKDEDTDEILLCDVTLRAENDLFLDNMPLSALQGALNAPLRVVKNDGESLYRALLGDAD